MISILFCLSFSACSDSSYTSLTLVSKSFFACFYFFSGIHFSSLPTFLYTELLSSLCRFVRLLAALCEKQKCLSFPNCVASKLHLLTTASMKNTICLSLRQIYETFEDDFVSCSSTPVLYRAKKGYFSALCQYLRHVLRFSLVKTKNTTYYTLRLLVILILSTVQGVLWSNCFHLFQVKYQGSLTLVSKVVFIYFIFFPTT